MPSRLNSSDEFVMTGNPPTTFDEGMPFRLPQEGFIDHLLSACSSDLHSRCLPPSWCSKFTLIEALRDR
jgi:hypothetical protein